MNEGGAFGIGRDGGVVEAPGEGPDLGVGEGIAGFIDDVDIG